MILCSLCAMYCCICLFVLCVCCVRMCDIHTHNTYIVCFVSVCVVCLSLFGCVYVSVCVRFRVCYTIHMHMDLKHIHGNCIYSPQNRG